MNYRKAEVEIDHGHLLARNESLPEKASGLLTIVQSDELDGAPSLRRRLWSRSRPSPPRWGQGEGMDDVHSGKPALIHGCWGMIYHEPRIQRMVFVLMLLNALAMWLIAQLNANRRGQSFRELLKRSAFQSLMQDLPLGWKLWLLISSVCGLLGIAYLRYATMES